MALKLVFGSRKSLLSKNIYNINTLKWTTVGFNVESGNADRINFYKNNMCNMHTYTVTELEV